MSLTELGLLFAVLAHSVAVIAAAIKLIAWIVKKQAVTDERIRQLQHQVDNDVTGRRVVGEMRNDIAVIKSQMSDIKVDLKTLHEKVG
ncbi:MAG: hypothetical protein AB7H77_01145 [Bdellovibrionales bacterium]